MKSSSLVMLVVVATAAPGCVFWRIRDEVTASNAKLGQVEAELKATNAALASTNHELENVQVSLERLDKTNALIGEVESGLGRIDRTNQSLDQVDERLRTLRTIDASMLRLDAHLASLRKSLGAIDSMLPFMGLDDSPVEPPAALPAAEGAAASEPAMAADGTVPATGASAPAVALPAGVEPAPARRDALIGAWVVQYPAAGEALVLLEGGRFIREGAGKPRESGAWTRDGRKLTLAGEPATRTGPDGQPVTTGSAVTAEIVAQSARSLTLDVQGRGLLVLAKP